MCVVLIILMMDIFHFGHALPPIPCDSSLSLDLIFMLNSQGKAYDPEYNIWQSMLDFTKPIVNESLPSNSRVGLINYSGCGSSFTVQQGQEQGRLNRVFGLSDYNHTQQIYDRIAVMGPDDINGGFNWVDQALGLALNEFQGNSSWDRSKMIILFTIGEPTLLNQGREPCDTFSAYISPTLRALRQLSVKIITIGIGYNLYFSADPVLTANDIDRYYRCLVDNFNADFYYATNYHALPLLLPAVKDNICTDTQELIINEVFISANDNLVFIKIYNPSIEVSLAGYSFFGLINYPITENVIIQQGQFFVISTMNLSIINGSEDLLISTSFVDGTMDNDYFKIQLFDPNGVIRETVERDAVFFPTVNENYSHQL